MSAHDWRNWETCDCGERGCRSYLGRFTTPSPQADLASLRGEDEARPESSRDGDLGDSGRAPN